MLLGPVVDPTAATAVAQALRLARDSVHEPLRANAIVFNADYVRAGVRWYARRARRVLDFATDAAVAADPLRPVLVVRGEPGPDRARRVGPPARRHRPDGRASSWCQVPRVVQYARAAVVASAAAGRRATPRDILP